MSYSVSNPPSAFASFGLSGSAGAMWSYSTTDGQVAVAAPDYISNAKALGMKVGDLVYVRHTVTNHTNICGIHAINAAGAGTLYVQTLIFNPNSVGSDGIAEFDFVPP